MSMVSRRETTSTKGVSAPPPPSSVAKPGGSTKGPPKKASQFVRYLVPLGLSLAGLAIIGVAGWLAYRAQMKDQVVASIVNVEADGMDATRLTFRYPILGRGDVTSHLRVTDWSDWPWAVGQTLGVRYDAYQPKTVGLDTNVLLMVGASTIGLVGTVLVIAVVVLALRNMRRPSPDVAVSH